MSSNPNRLSYELAVDFDEKEQIAAAFRKIRDSFEQSTRIFSTAGAEAQKLVNTSIDAGNRLQAARRAQISELQTADRRERDAFRDANRERERIFRNTIETQIGLARSAVASENAARNTALANFRQDIKERAQAYKELRDQAINAVKTLINDEIKEQRAYTALYKSELDKQEAAHKAAVRDQIEAERLLAIAKERELTASNNLANFGATIPRNERGVATPDAAQLAEGNNLLEIYRRANIEVQETQRLVNATVADTFREAAALRNVNSELEKQVTVQERITAEGNALVAETQEQENKKYQAVRNRLARELVDERATTQAENRLLSEELAHFIKIENQKLAVLRANNRVEEREQLRAHQERLDQLRRELAASVEAEREASRLRQSSRRAGEDRNRLVGDVGSAIGNVGSIAVQTGAALTAAITVPTALAAKLGLEFINVREKFVAAFAAATGTEKEQALTAFRQLQQISQQTGISLDSLVQSSLRLADSGIAGDRLAASLQAAAAVGQIAADRGDDATQAAENYGRTLGKIQQQQVINGRQLDALNNQGIRATDALIAAYERQNGVLLSAAALKEKLRKGEISGEFAIDALNKELNDRFQGRLQGRVKELSGAFESLKTSVREAFGEALLPVVDKLTKLFQDLGPKVQAVSDKFREMSDNQKLAVVGLIGVTAAIGPAFVAFGQLLNVIQNTVEAYRALLSIQLLSGAALGKTLAGGAGAAAAGGAATVAANSAAAAVTAGNAASLAAEGAYAASVSAAGAGSSAAFAAQAAAEASAAAATTSTAAGAAAGTAGASIASVAAAIAAVLAIIAVAVDVIRRVWIQNSSVIRETFQFAMDAVYKSTLILSDRLAPLWAKVKEIYTRAIQPLVDITDSIFKEVLLIIQQFFAGVGQGGFESIVDKVVTVADIVLRIVKGLIILLEPLALGFSKVVIAAIEVIGATVRSVMRLINAILAGDFVAIARSVGEIVGQIIGIVVRMGDRIAKVLVDTALYITNLIGAYTRQLWDYLKNLSAAEVIKLANTIVTGLALLPVLIAQKGFEIGKALWEGVVAGYKSGSADNPLPNFNFQSFSEKAAKFNPDEDSTRPSNERIKQVRLEQEAQQEARAAQAAGSDAASKAAESAAAKAQKLLDTIEKATIGVQLAITKLRGELGFTEIVFSTLVAKVNGYADENETRIEASARGFLETIDAIRNGVTGNLFAGTQTLVAQEVAIREEAEERIAKFKEGKDIKTAAQRVALAKYEEAERALASAQVSKLALEAGRALRDFQDETRDLVKETAEFEEPYLLRKLAIERELTKLRETTKFTSQEDADAQIKARRDALQNAETAQYTRAYKDAVQEVEKKKIQAIFNERARQKALIDFEYKERLRLLTIQFGGAGAPDAVKRATEIADAERKLTEEEILRAETAYTLQVEETNEALRVGAILNDAARELAQDKFEIEKAYNDVIAQGLSIDQARTAEEQKRLEIANNKALGASDALDQAIAGQANPLLRNKKLSDEDKANALANAGGSLQQLRQDIADVEAAFGSAGASYADFKARLDTLRNVPTTLGGAFKTLGAGFKQIAKDALFSKQAIAGIASSIGTILGEVIAGQGKLGEKIRSFFFNLLGDLAIQFGNFAIAVGIGMNALGPFFGLTGGAAIAAGIALVALGTVLKALAGTASAAAETGGGAASTAGTGGPEGRDRAPQRLPFGTSGEFLVQVEFKDNGSDELGAAAVRHMLKNGFVTTTTLGRQHRSRIKDANG